MEAFGSAMGEMLTGLDQTVRQVRNPHRYLVQGDAGAESIGTGESYLDHPKYG